MSQTNTYLVAAATTNITTSAFLEIASSLNRSAGKLLLVNTTTKLLQLAVGAAGSEVPVAIIGAVVGAELDIYLQPGDRLSVKSVDSASATTGFLAVSLLG